SAGLQNPCVCCRVSGAVSGCLWALQTLLQLMQYGIGRAAGAGRHVAKGKLNGVTIVAGMFITTDDAGGDRLQAVIMAGQIQQQALAGLQPESAEHGQAADGKVVEGGRLVVFRASKPVEQTKFEF